MVISMTFSYYFSSFYCERRSYDSHNMQIVQIVFPMLNFINDFSLESYLFLR